MKMLNIKLRDSPQELVEKENDEVEYYDYSEKENFHPKNGEFSAELEAHDLRWVDD